MGLDIENKSMYVVSMANTSQIRYDQRFNMKVDQLFFDVLDKIRKREIPEMSRSDMVRKLVLEAEKKRK